jgi:hypothetical protein
LTSISQQQFWSDYKFENYGDGTAQGCISVDISNWNAKGEVDGPSGGKPAVNCTIEEIKDEVWYQLCIFTICIYFGNS